MAGTGENFSSDAVVDSVKFGFERAEMYKENISGTVDPYDRHVFLCYKTYDAWPARVEASDSDPLPKHLAGALKARKNDIKLKTRVTICEGRDGTELLDGDVLIFPEMIKYRGLTEEGVDTFIEDVLVNSKPWASGEQKVLTGSHVFVCAHNTRDRRCGVCGPALIEKFKGEIELKGLKDQVFVSACSHTGGHKYAGNLIIFTADTNGKVSGHWFGYVTPNDVSELLDQHIGKGEIIKRIWRGQMGVTVKEAEKVNDQKLPNGSVIKNDSVNLTLKKAARRSLSLKSLARRNLHLKAVAKAPTGSHVAEMELRRKYCLLRQAVAKVPMGSHVTRMMFQ